MNCERAHQLNRWAKAARTYAHRLGADCETGHEILLMAAEMEIQAINLSGCDSYLVIR
jgi:hypothetical protein